MRNRNTANGHMPRSFRGARWTFAAASALALSTLAGPIGAQEWTGQWTSMRPDGHAPIGVMGDHVHEKGESMISYRFMRMMMEGNRVGTDAASTSEVLSSFMVAPLKMPMSMHMVGFMYAPSDRVTLMGMLPWVSMSMDHVTRMGGEFTTESSGLGDIKLGGLVGLKTEGKYRAHLNASVSLPTGGIEQTDVTPASAPNESQLPYPMQIGSGTVDLKPGLTFLSMGRVGSWGAQGSATLRMGENDRGYSLGNVVSGTAWLALKLTDQISTSFRLEGTSWGDIEGADPAYMNLMMVPTVNPDLRGGTRFDLPIGLNYYINNGPLAGHRIAVEYAFPIHQDLNGPQLETDGILTIGWQKSFAPFGDSH